MAKDLAISVLMDFYGDLLTPKQIEALDCYYNQDLSLAEIAEQMEVSRQGVRDFIKKGESHLNEFEDKLCLVERFTQINKITTKMQNIILDMDKNKATSELMTEIDKIKRQL